MFKKFLKHRQGAAGEYSNNRRFLESPLAKVEMLLGNSALARFTGDDGGGTDLSKVGEELEAKDLSSIVETSNSARRNKSTEHWFTPDQPLDGISRRGKGRNSDSWFRLEAFLKSYGEEELRKIDPTYGKPL